MVGFAMLRLNGFTREDRFSVAARMREALTGSGAWITGHQQFSDLALCINFEIERRHIGRLGQLLAGCGLQLSDESLAGLSSAAAKPGPNDDVAGTLQAVFVAAERT